MNRFFVLAVAVLAGCSGVPPTPDAGPDPVDASVPGSNAGVVQDAGAQDDAGLADAGSEQDAGAGEDAGIDAGPGDLCTIGNGGCDPLTVVNGQASCGACPAGYSGDGVTGCVDLDECTTIPDAGCVRASSAPTRRAPSAAWISPPASCSSTLSGRRASVTPAPRRTFSRALPIS